MKPKGSEAVFQAAAGGWIKVLEWVLARDAAAAQRREWRGRTPLHLAAKAGQPAAVRLLLERGADVNARRKDGTTPLGMAAAKGRQLLIRLLEGYGGTV